MVPEMCGAPISVVRRGAVAKISVAITAASAAWSTSVRRSALGSAPGACATARLTP
jgi:hypothetical protein